MRFDLSIPVQLSAALVPDLIVIGGALVLLLVAVWGAESDARQRMVGWASLAVCALAAAAIAYEMSTGASAGPGAIAVDGFRWVSDLLILLATALSIALTMDYGRRSGMVLAEAHVLMLLSASGMMLLAAARDLIVVFLGIELMSIGINILSGLDRRSGRSAEAALKYFLLGAFASAFLLYGIALVYGATGSTDIGRIAAAAGSDTVQTPVLVIGVGLMLVGFSFKVAAAPFHMWTPDVYDGAPTPFTAFMASGVKIGAFAAFLRIWIEAFGPLYSAWHPAVWWLAVITMVVGNLIALSQRNIKRMLAYSSIAHAGYILVAVVVGAAGAPAFLFYLLAYTLATVGAFAVVVVVGDDTSELDIDHYSGLWTVRPWLAFAMAVFMLALLGFPIAGGMGFFAKWYVLEAALSNRPAQTRLAVVLVITSVISAGYYLGVIRAMFMRPRAADAPAPAPAGWLTGTVIAVAASALLLFGIFPNPVIARAQKSAPVPASAAKATAQASPAAQVSASRGR